VVEQAPVALAGVKRQAVIDHVLASARQLVLAGGLDVTMDQLADASGVSRSTLFRHFTSRDGLLAAAFDAGMIDYRLGLPRHEGELRPWLRATCEAAHRMNSTIGPGFFELASRPDLSPELAAVEGRRRAAFGAATADIAATLWRAAGRRGRTPRDLADVVSVHLSPFFTAATTIDTGKSWQISAELAYSAILAVVTQDIAGR
jgi:AcrR family transcriptional regulator